MALLRWWYGAGWQRFVGKVGARVNATLAFFSVGLLLRTLFDPFRQVGAGAVKGTLQDQMRALGDRAFSRVIGAFVRSLFIIIGGLAALLIGVVGLVGIVMWPLVPVLPIGGAVAAIVGWTP